MLVLAYPVSRIGALPSLNYNEDWNAYRARSAAAMHPLYAHAPALWITNYPPLSFQTPAGRDLGLEAGLLLLKCLKPKAERLVPGSVLDRRDDAGDAALYGWFSLL